MNKSDASTRQRIKTQEQSTNSNTGTRDEKENAENASKNSLEDERSNCGAIAATISSPKCNSGGLAGTTTHQFLTLAASRRRARLEINKTTTTLNEGSLPFQFGVNARDNQEDRELLYELHPLNGPKLPISKPQLPIPKL
jgi:hypothetical protein